MIFQLEMHKNALATRVLLWTQRGSLQHSPNLSVGLTDGHIAAEGVQSNPRL